MSIEHGHAFCVDAECECGVKLSSYTQQLSSENADLKIDLQMANEENADLRRQLAETQTIEARKEHGHGI